MYFIYPKYILFLLYFAPLTVVCFSNLASFPAGSFPKKFSIPCTMVLISSMQNLIYTQVRSSFFNDMCS